MGGRANQDFKITCLDHPIRCFRVIESKCAAVQVNLSACFDLISNIMVNYLEEETE